MSTSLSIAHESQRRIIRQTGLLLFCSAGAMLAAVLTAMLAEEHPFAIAVVVVACFLLVMVWRQPVTGIVLLVFCAAWIEQFKPPKGIAGDLTDRIPFFTSLSDGVGLQGVYVTPAELAISAIIVIWLIKGIANRELRLPRSHLAGGMVVMVALVALAAVQGVARDADLKALLWEVRPWAYLAVTYILASQLVRTPRALQALMWAIVIGSGLKAFQGVARYWQTRNVFPRPDELLAHEEAVFFGIFMLLTCALWLFGQKGWLRRVATALLPLVVFANLANTRRTAWVILGLGLVGLLPIAWLRFPRRRQLLRSALIGLFVGSLLYVPIFWNSSGVLGQPVRAFRSSIQPSPRDRESNGYRALENANLGVNIRKSAPFGEGFGLPIKYGIPITDIRNRDSFISYVPHDGILYVWMRMGFPGAIAFFFLFGAALVSACRLARAGPNDLALFASLVVCALLAYIVMGYYDLGLFWFRIAIVMGCLLGALEAAWRMVPPATMVTAR